MDPMVKYIMQKRAHCIALKEVDRHTDRQGDSKEDGY